MPGEIKVAVGGTFEIFHKGHEALLTKAFEIGDYIYVGVTSDKLVRELGKNPLKGYKERARIVQQYIDKFGKNYSTVELNDPYGPLLNKDVDYAVVTVETMARVLKANQIRTKNGLKKVLIYIIPFINALDGQPISSTKIKEGIIDRFGIVKSTQPAPGL